jgi:hypothetical protein
MSAIDATKAARNTLAWWSFRAKGKLPQPRRSVTGNTVAHQHWILRAVISGEVSGSKAERWLCYAQGYLVAKGALSLGNCKLANAEAKLPEMASV